MIYFGKRFYNPSDGRWLTPDPLGLKASPNLYAFVSTPPLTHYDHYGLEEVAKNNFADLKYYAQTCYNTSLDYTFRSPRFTGTLEAFGGLAEMSMGTSLFATTSAASAPLSFVLLAHGFDHFTTGLKSAITARHQTSLTNLSLQSVGFSENVANFLDNSAFLLAPTAALWTQRAAYTVPCFANNVLKHPTSTFQLTEFRPHLSYNTEISQTTNILSTQKNLILSKSRQNLNPFKWKTFKEIDQCFRSKGFQIKGPDPLNGKGSYFHPATNRKYYLDSAGKTYRGNITELPHVNVHYKIPVQGLTKKRFPIGDYLYEFR